MVPSSTSQKVGFTHHESLENVTFSTLSLQATQFVDVLEFYGCPGNVGFGLGPLEPVSAVSCQSVLALRAITPYLHRPKIHVQRDLSGAVNLSIKNSSKKLSKQNQYTELIKKVFTKLLIYPKASLKFT